MHDFGGEIMKCRDHLVVWLWQCGSVAPWPVNVKKPMHRKHLITRYWELELATSISPGAVFHRPFWKYQLPRTITPAQVIDNRPGGAQQGEIETNNRVYPETKLLILFWTLQFTPQ